ncbi:MAG: hypothetical protein WCX71_01690 [Candidatus Buchananbacteria bacterium]
MKKTLIIVAIIFFSFVTGAKSSQAAWELIKSDNASTVYYLDSHNIRHPFSDTQTFSSWYGNDKSKIVKISEELLEKYSLGKNVTMRPGSYLIKAQTSPTVYAVEQGGVIRPISDEGIAKEIFGINWNQRVVDVPDVFFSNYTLGKPISQENDIPNNILYYDTNKKTYYYKFNDLLQPFSSLTALAQNGYQIDSAIKLPYTLTIREKPIVARDKNIFNPAAEPITSKIDCANKKLKAAFIFVADKEAKPEELANVEKIKNKVAERFAWATYNLAEIDLDYPTTVIYDDGYILNKQPDGTTEVNNEVVNNFYENNADNFDFVFIWTDFKTPGEEENEIANFTSVTNLQEGVGRNRLDASRLYGSTGKLKGIIMMGNINKFDPNTETGSNSVLNIVLHEIGHQWSAYVGFNDGSNNPNLSLLRPDKTHWSYYAGFISPLGGSGWIDNGDGTFTSQLAQMSDGSLRPYSNLDLYLMGLMPYQFMPPIMYVEPKTPGETGNKIHGTAKYVNVDQIIKTNGQIKCGAPLSD